VYKVNRERLLGACRAYLEGAAAVGDELAGGRAAAGSSEGTPQGRTSEGFRLVFADVLQRLQAALERL
jgi:hypothetical protein